MAEEMGWWKCKHGAPFNGNFAPIAEMAKATRGEVANVDYALRDCASKAKDRGSVAAFNAAYVAAFMQIKLAKVVAIVKAMRELGMIDNERMPSFDSLQQIGSSTGRVRRWRAAKRDETHSPDGRPGVDETHSRGGRPDVDETHVTDVTLHETPETPETQSQSQSQESEKKKIDSDSARQRAGERALTFDDRELKADLRALEARCLALVIDCPVVRDANFGPILQLIERGFTDAQVIEGVRQALGKLAVPPRSWGAFVAFIERIPKAKGAVVVDLRPARESNVAATIRQLQEIRAEDDARMEGAS